MPTTTYLHMETLKKVGRKVSIFELFSQYEISHYLSIQEKNNNLLEY